VKGTVAIAAIVAAAIWGWTALAGADPPTGIVTTFPIPTLTSGPSGIVGGPNGDVWWVEPDADAIGTVVGGAATEFSVSKTALAPVAITRGAASTPAANAFWLVLSDADISQLDVMTTAGTLGATMSVRLPGDEQGAAIATDSSGNVWIADPRENSIEEVAGPMFTAETNMTLGTNALEKGADPNSIVAGPDGQTMWFTEPGTDLVGSITATGAVTQHQLPVSGTLGNIVLGSDGNLWVGVVYAAVSDPAWLVQITPAGVTTAFPVPTTSNANPDVLAAGPDQRLWMADGAAGNGDLTAMTTTGDFSDYQKLLPAEDAISSIVADPAAGADALWMTDETADAVVRVQLLAPTGPPVTTSSSTTTSTSTSTTTSTSTSTSSIPPPLAATLAPVFDVSKSGATLSGSITEPAGSPPTSVTYHFEYGTTTAYGSSTTPAMTTATPAGADVSAPLSGLTPYTTYHYRLVASDCAASSCQVESSDQSFTTGSTLVPQANTSVGAAPTAGTILIKLPGSHRYKRLAAGEVIPVGSVIDARHGTILIKTSLGGGEVASGLFSGGIFEVTQPHGSSFTDLRLESSFAVCRSKQLKAPLARAATAKKKKPKPKAKTKRSHKVVNQVFGNAHGHFATQGHYATAADEGTGWRTSDRCDGTQIAVSAGQVVVTNLRTHRHFTLTAGHRRLFAGSP
jgi:streptogramin lyase